ncbi:MAG: AMMECR1 domain-containing protein [Sulfurimonas sp.]
MSRSVLLQLARDSIEEVIEFDNKIDKKALLAEHPLLNENIPTKIDIFVDDETHGSCELTAENSLLENVIKAAKTAAFIDQEPLTSSKYVRCQIEITLHTPEGVISEKDKPLIEDL